MLAGCTIVLGVAAHVLGGGGDGIECLPLLVAATSGVATALAARRIAGHTHRGAAAAVTLLGIGQLGMHLALSVSLSTHLESMTAQSPLPPPHVLGLTCGLVLAHTATTGLLVVLLLGAHRSADLAFHLLSHAPCRSRWLVVPAPRRSDWRLLATNPNPEWTTAALLVAQQWHYGPVRPRRGPPRMFTA